MADAAEKAPLTSAPAARPWYRRPLPLAGVAAATVALILVIVLPATLATKKSSSTSSSNVASSSGGSSTSSSAPPTGSSTTVPTYVSAGCGKKQSTGFSNDFTNQHITSGDYVRNYSVSVPSDYNDDLSEQWPLILDFHGNLRNSTWQYNNSMYWDNDLGAKYLAVYPEGVDLSWQGASYAVKGVDDLQFVTDLLAHLNDTYCLDSSRVYASGKSNGAGFVDTLACSSAGDPFAAFAMASAALYTDTSRSSCNTTRAILESHGLADTTIPYDGGTGTGGDLPNVGDWIDWWSERNGCSSSPSKAEYIQQPQNGFRVDSFDCDGAGNVTQHYRITKLGHCWPSGNGKNWDAEFMPSECSDRSVDFTEVVVEWFGNWTLESAP